jgi:hypothetical protein
MTVPEEICQRLEKGENIVQIIYSLELPIWETLNKMYDCYEGEMMAAHKKYMKNPKILVSHHALNI